jgi:hypothetical protein
VEKGNWSECRRSFVDDGIRIVQVDVVVDGSFQHAVIGRFDLVFFLQLVFEIVVEVIVEIIFVEVFEGVVFGFRSGTAAGSRGFLAPIHIVVDLLFFFVLVIPTGSQRG